MSVHEDIKTYVGGYIPLIGEVGDRFYPVVLPQEPVLPAVVYTVMPGIRDVSHKGDAGWIEFRLQFDCYALTPLVAATIADVLKDALYNWTGSAGYVAFPNTPEDVSDLELGRFRVMMDCMVQKGAITNG